VPQLKLDSRFDEWIADLQSRHLADLTFAEVSRSLRALSSAYVERRSRLREGAALSGAGKRAAFALFYGPLHYLLIKEIVRALPAATHGAATLVDLGCGTGAGGAAWATSSVQPPRVVGIDRHPWAVAEARHTYRTFGLKARTVQADLIDASLPEPPALVLAAFAANELDDPVRARFLERLLHRAAHGDRILIVEPLARSAVPWWSRWREKFLGAGGRADEWRFRVALPPIVAKLDRAAGLDHRELTGRSLWLPGVWSA
jgi:SAM-dependent methyltransferase